MRQPQVALPKAKTQIAWLAEKVFIILISTSILIVGQTEMEQNRDTFEVYLLKQSKQSGKL